MPEIVEAKPCTGNGTVRDRKHFGRADGIILAGVSDEKRTQMRQKIFFKHRIGVEYDGPIAREHAFFGGHVLCGRNALLWR